jgi:hypothetical protein
MPGAKIDLTAAATALGRRGGLRDGPARAEALTPERREHIAREGGRARWAKRKPKAKAVGAVLWLEAIL